ncbi:MAG: alginate export family protein, partial [Planctomycetota bacterium]
MSESEPEEGYGVSGTDVDGPEDPSGYGKGTGEGDDTGEADEDAPKFSVELPWSTHLKIGGQYRARGEVRAHGAYQSGGGVAAETDFVEQRIRLNFDFQVLEHVRAFIEAQDSRVWGDTGLNKDEPEDVFDLRQGYVEFSFKKLWQVPVKVRAGRYEVPQLGDQRLISSLDWSNVTRQWDGVQATYETDALWATAFAQNIREGHTETTGASANDDFWLTGAYVSFRAIPDTWLDGF